MLHLLRKTVWGVPKTETDCSTEPLPRDHANPGSESRQHLRVPGSIIYSSQDLEAAKVVLQ